MAVSQHFNTLTEPAFFIDAGIVLAAYMAPSVAGPVAGGVMPVDVPNEAYGLAEIVVASMALSGSNKTLVQYGGAVYTLDQLAARFGVRSAIADMAGGN